MTNPFVLLSDKKLNELRGKAMVGHITKAEMLSVFNHLTVMESILDESDSEDVFGTEGWRRHFGLV